MSDYVRPAFAICLPTLGGLVGTCVTKNDWQKASCYKNLKKPSCTPPERFCTPIILGLYASMGYASYIVWRDGGGFAGIARLPLICYGANLLLAWTSPFFLKKRQLAQGLISSLLVWSATVATAVTFRSVSSNAAYMVLPFLGWTTFFCCFRFSLWRNNRKNSN